MNVLNLIPKGLLVLSLATAPLLSQAQPREGRQGARMGFLKELDLTEEQREQLKELRKDGKDDHKEKREALKKLREEFKALMTSETATDEQIRTAFAKLQEERKAMAIGAMDKMLAVRKILTPEQRKKAHALREKHKGKKGKRHGQDQDHDGPGDDGGGEDDDF